MLFFARFELGRRNPYARETVPHSAMKAAVKMSETQFEIDVIAAGHLCIDLIPQMDSVPLAGLSLPGRLYEVDAMEIATGGSVSNTGLALHKLGARVRLMSLVGDDAIGKLIIDFLKSKDAQLIDHIKIIQRESSSYTIVLSPERADRIFLHCPGTNSLFKSDDVDLDTAEKARILHFGYPPIVPQMIKNDGAELLKLLKALKERGVVTSLDMTMPDPASLSGHVNWSVILRNISPYLDIFIPSFEEIVFMLRRPDFERKGSRLGDLLNASYVEELVDTLLDWGVAIAGIKAGVDGILLKTASSARLDELRKRLPLGAAWDCAVAWHPAFRVEVAGTTGAGDAAYAGMLLAMVKGYSPQEVVRWGCAVGACNVEAADAVSGIRIWGETEARLNAFWELRPSGLAPYRPAPQSEFSLYHYL